MTISALIGDSMIVGLIAVCGIIDNIYSVYIIYGGMHSGRG